MMSPSEETAVKTALISPPAISRWATVGLGIALVFFTFSAALSYLNQRRFVEAETLASSSRLLMFKVEELRSLVQSAETTQRAYLFTEQPEFRTDHEEVIKQFKPVFKDLRSLGTTAEQQSAVIALEKHAQARLDNLAATLVTYETLGREAAQQQVTMGKGQELMDTFRGAAREFIKHENTVHGNHRESARRNLRITQISDLVVAALGLLLAGAAVVQLRREFLRRYSIARQLDEQRKLLQTTVLSIGDAVVTTDANSRIRSLNAVAERLLSWPAAEAAGRPLTDVFRIVSEKDRAPLEDVAMRSIREGLIRQSPNTLLIARDNTERRIEGSVSPIRTSDGGIRGAVLTFRDVTDRRRAEEALRRGEERLRRALRASRQVAWELDLRTDLVIRSENAAELFGLPPFGSVAEQFELIHPEDRPSVETALAGLKQGDGEYAVEYRVTLADGRLLWLSDKAELRRDERGAPAVIVGMLGDITEIKRAEADLIEADHRKDRFLATLAHELRNPLAPISNAVQAWAFFKDDPVEMESLREMLERQVAQMSRLIDDLLDVSRITRGKIQLQRTTTDLRSILDAAVECVRPNLDQHRHRLRLDVPATPLVIDGDEARLVQAFTNLLQNAVKYTDDGGTITITSTFDAEAGTVTTAIRDNGVGIPPHMLGKIFDMFAQVDRTLDRSHGGLGIGLTLVRTLIGLHSGTVQAASNGPGLGSTFSVTLPAAVETVANDESPAFAGAAANGDDLEREAPVADLHDRPTLKVLVVDDMRPSARTLAMMLEGIGQQTCIAHDGATALDVFDEFRPDVVLLDIAMPGMDGYEACRRLRERPAPLPMIVALTGYTQEEDRRKAFDAGFDKHLVKPTSLDALKELLDEAVPLCRTAARTD